MSNINEMKPAKEGPPSFVFVIAELVMLIIAGLFFNSSMSAGKAIGVAIFALGSLGIWMWQRSVKQSTA
jgi:hypothetical protein